MLNYLKKPLALVPLDECTLPISVSFETNDHTVTANIKIGDATYESFTEATQEKAEAAAQFWIDKYAAKIVESGGGVVIEIIIDDL